MPKLKQGENDLYTWCLQNGEYGMKLLFEFGDGNNSQKFYDKNDKQIKYPHDFARGTGKPIKWTCRKGHKFVSSGQDRTTYRSGCPYCHRKIATKENNLLTWCQSNGDFGQQLINEWTGICDDGNHYEMTNVTKGSQRKMFWKCSKGHVWASSIKCRTMEKSMCKYCNAKGTSYPEQFIYWSLKQLYPQTISRGKYQGIEFDITVPEEKLCIEYSPTHWHEDKYDRDQLKKDICKEHNIRLIYIKEDSDNIYNEVWDANYICFHMEQTKRDEYCIKIIDHILQSLEHKISDINIDLVKRNALESSQGIIEYEKSLEYSYPELAKEWHQNLNMIRPNQIKPVSNNKAFWVCSKCGYGKNGEWRTYIYSRTISKISCPYCGYNVLENKYYNSKLGKPLLGINDLKSQCAELAKEYNEHNKKKPDEVKISSNNNAYWTCNNCGYGNDGQWSSIIRMRIKRKSGCPQCGYNWYKAQTGQPQKLKKGYTLKIQPKSEVNSTDISE